MRKLCDFKQIACHSVHKLTGSVAVKEFEIKALHMSEQIISQIRFNSDAEHMTPVSDYIVHSRPYYKCCRNDNHYHKKCIKLSCRQKLVHCASCHKGKCQIYKRHNERAGKVQYKQASMGSEILHQHSKRCFTVIFVVHI